MPDSANPDKFLLQTCLVPLDQTATFSAESVRAHAMRPVTSCRAQLMPAARPCDYLTQWKDIPKDQTVVQLLPTKFLPSTLRVLTLCPFAPAHAFPPANPPALDAHPPFFPARPSFRRARPPSLMSAPFPTLARRGPWGQCADAGTATERRVSGDPCHGALDAHHGRGQRAGRRDGAVRVHVGPADGIGGRLGRPGCQEPGPCRRGRKRIQPSGKSRR